jgi:hypothetical protein
MQLVPGAILNYVTTEEMPGMKEGSEGRMVRDNCTFCGS